MVGGSREGGKEGAEGVGGWEGEGDGGGLSVHSVGELNDINTHPMTHGI